MPLDLIMFSDKLRRYCVQLNVLAAELGRATGINQPRVEALLSGQKEPTGDEVLILADYFKCDFKFFISNERLAPFEQTEQLFRKHGDALTSEDRWAIQEFLFLCECEAFLLSKMPNGDVRHAFTFTKQGTFCKAHGHEAAKALRHHLGYDDNNVPRDVYRDFRSIGIHVFRRRLANSSISGIFIRHPIAGPCALINYDEDIYRQRFSAAHETAHAILDDGNEYSVSFARWDRNDLSEVRANAFASHYLIPPAFLAAMPSNIVWNEAVLRHWAHELRVNPEPLAIALKERSALTDTQTDSLRKVKIPMDQKKDPELADDLPPRSRDRRKTLLERGLSNAYVNLCFAAYEQQIVSAGRLAEMLLSEPSEMVGLAELFGRRWQNGH